MNTRCSHCLQAPRPMVDASALNVSRFVLQEFATGFPSLAKYSPVHAMIVQAGRRDGKTRTMLECIKRVVKSGLTCRYCLPSVGIRRTMELSFAQELSFEELKRCVLECSSDVVDVAFVDDVFKFDCCRIHAIYTRSKFVVAFGTPRSIMDRYPSISGTVKITDENYRLFLRHAEFRRRLCFLYGRGLLTARTPSGLPCSDVHNVAFELFDLLQLPKEGEPADAP